MFIVPDKGQCGNMLSSCSTVSTHLGILFAQRKNATMAASAKNNSNSLIPSRRDRNTSLNYHCESGCHSLHMFLVLFIGPKTAAGPDLNLPHPSTSYHQNSEASDKFAPKVSFFDSIGQTNDLTIWLLVAHTTGKSSFAPSHILNRSGYP